MATISPLLQNRLNTTNNKTQIPNNHHEKIYQDLQKRAHEAKPNEAKAKMVKEGILGNPITDVVDTLKDAGNFFKTVKTGNMGDNNLGRINDLGLKIGAGIIATFLALHSKTKKDSIMRFIGGATFIAMMDLWPKLFINLPARLVHGFRIDRKYISAQGDKKDFFLDNQYLVWDAYPEEQLRKDAKNAGIDYDSKNGKEKIQRKMQKTALQNRTLWMATAGFATPLLTSMIGNFVEPQVEKAIVERGIKKVGKIADSENGMADFIKNSANIDIRNTKELDGLLERLKQSSLTDENFKDIAKALSPFDFLSEFKDIDDKTLYKGMQSSQVVEELKKVYKSLVTLDETSLREKLGTIRIPDNSIFATEETKYSSLDVEGIIKKLQGNLKLENIKEVLEQNGVAPKDIDDILQKTTRNNQEFIDFVKKYNEGPVAQLRGRLKAFGKLANPIAGSKSESATTLEYSKAMKKIIKSLGITPKDYNELEDGAKVFEKLSKMIQNGVKDEQQYKQFLESISSGEMDSRVVELIGKLEEAADSIGFDNVDDNNIKALNKSLLGGDSSIIEILKANIRNKKLDIDSIKARLILCANFERRVLNDDLKNMSDENLSALREIIYSGNLPKMANRGYADNPNDLIKQAGKVFGATKDENGNIIRTAIEKFNPDEIDALKKLKLFSKEEDSENFLKETLEAMKKIIRDKGTQCGQQSEDYARSVPIVSNIKRAIKDLNNNHKWLKAVAPMTIALIAITLLVQPFFGKIDKEFPEEKKGGGAK